MRIFQPTVTGSNTTTGSLHISGPVYFYTLETSSVSHILTYNTASGQVFYTASEAIGRRPGSPTQSIQFNNNNEFSGSANFIFDNNNNIVYLTGSSLTSGSITLTGSMFVSGAISASLEPNTVGFYGTASWAQSASQATSASYAATASAAPLDTYIQYNKEGLLGAEQYFRYIYTSHSLQQGDNVIASGDYSHAQGSSSIASGDYSHAEGRGNQAIGEGSHAKGRNNYASASYSHVGGLQNTSSGIYQTVVGQNSVQLLSQSAFIVGGGRATNARNNALVVIPKTTTGDFQSDSILEILVNTASISASYFYLNNLPTSPELNVLVYNSESNQVFYTSSTSVGGGGSGNPAPLDTYVQYNNNDEFGAEIFFRYVYISHSLLLGEAMGNQGDFGVIPSFGRFSVHLGEGSATAINGAYSASMVSGNIVLDAIHGNVTVDFPSDGVFYGGNLYDPGGTLVSKTYFEISSVTFDGTNTIISSSTDNSLSNFNPLFPSNIYPGFVADPFNAGNWNGNIYTADEGNFNYGYASLAAGIYSYAFGISSHAEGNGAVSLGAYSHAEGNMSIAGGFGSHAEGNTTRAIGNYSHAEGSSTQAQGEYSHTEGEYTTAVGDGSHAEGQATTAIGIFSHTEGLHTSASGDYQLVIGQYNKVLPSQSSFIIGDGTANNDRHNLLFASQSHFEVSASKVFFQGLSENSQLNVLVYNTASGQVYYTSSFGGGGGTPAPQDTWIQYNSGSTFGATGSFRFIYTSQSLQQGNSTIASGPYSHAQGSSSISYGVASHTEGWNTIASGSYSTVVGQYNIALPSQSAFIIGDGYISCSIIDAGTLNGDTDIGENVFIIDNTVSPSSLLIGTTLTVTGGGGNETFTITKVTLNLGNYEVEVTPNAAQKFSNGSPYSITACSFVRHNLLFASRSWFDVSASNVFLQGIPTSSLPHILSYHSESGRVYYMPTSSLIIKPAPSNSYIQYNSGSEFGAEEYFRYIYTSHSLQQGNEVTASGYWSHAQGSGSITYGTASHAEGYRTTSSGDYSHAEGRGVKAVGESSHAEGNSTISFGGASHAEGFQTLASGSSAHAEGSNTIALGLSSHAEGSGSISSGSYSHAEGYSTIASGSYSHTEGNLSLALGIGSHAEGSLTTASGDYSHAEGYQTIASGSYSHAEGSFDKGSSVIASGYASHAEGLRTTAEGSGSHSEGMGTLALGQFSHAEGLSTSAIGSGSHAAGNTSFAYGDYSSVAGAVLIASGAYQFIVGQYNVTNTSQSAFIIGDGDESNRHNVLFVSKSHFEASASNTFLQGLPTSPETHLLVYNTSSGQVYYTASSAVGGGGSRAFKNFVTNIVGGSTSEAITHNLGTRDIHVSVYENGGTYDTVYPDIQRTDLNTVTLLFNFIPTSAQYSVYIST
jgi:hypothetical protein